MLVVRGFALKTRKPRVSRASGHIGFWAQKKPLKAALAFD
jgi:hypothetical protein